MIHAYGASTDRHLGIPGEDLAGQPSGHRLRRLVQRPPRLRRSRVRPLVRTRGGDRQRQRRHGRGPDARAHPRGARGHRHRRPRDRPARRRCGVREIVILGRRGPAQAAFTNPELRELGEMKDADVYVDPAEVELDDLQPRLPRVRRGGHHHPQERRDLHRVLPAPAGGQAQANRAAVPSLAGRDPGRRQGRAPGRRPQRALPRRLRGDPGSRHRRARDDRVRARLALDRIRGGRAWTGSRSTSAAA